MKQQNNVQSPQNQNFTITITSCKDPSNIDMYSYPELPKNMIKLFSDGQQGFVNIDQQSQYIQSQQSSGILKIKENSKRDNKIFKTFGDDIKKDGDLPREKSRERGLSQEKKQIFSECGDVKNRNKGVKQTNFLISLAQEDNKSSKSKIQQASNEIEKQKNLQSECYIYGNSKNLQKSVLKITKSRVSIGPIIIAMQKIMKIKIFPSQICQQYEKISKDFFELSDINEGKFFKENCSIQKENIIKVTILDNTINFIQRYPVLLLPDPKQSYSPSIIPSPQSPSSPITSRLPLPFLTYAKIILKKLKQIYPLIKSTEWNPPDFLQRALLKANSSNKAINKSKFSRELGKKNFGFIHGKVYKKSQHKLKWQKRYVIINEEGVYSYKNQHDEAYSFSIQGQSIKYMWTWFSILKVDKDKDKSADYEFEADKQQNLSSRHGNLKEKEDSNNESLSPKANEVKQINEMQNPYLIVKLKHGFNGQTQFGIPICGYDNEVNMQKNWLFAFYKLLSKYQY